MTVEVQRPTSPDRDGPGTSRAARCRTIRGPRRPGRTSSTVPTRARSSRVSGRVTVSVTDTLPSATRRVAGLVRDDDAGRGRHLGADDRRGSVTLDPEQRPREPVDTSGRPAGRHAADPVVVGRGAPQDERRGRGEKRVDESAVGVEVDGRSGLRRRRGGLECCDGRPPSIASCRAQTSKPAGAHARPRRRRDPDGQESLSGTVAGRDPAGQVDGRPCAGFQRRELERAAGDANAVHRQLVGGRQPRSVEEVLVVLDLDASCGEVRCPARDPDRRRERPVLPHGGLRASVRPDEAVGHEVAVMRLLAEVAAVGPAAPAIRQVLDEAVVPELPDEAALEPGRRIRSRPSTRPASRCCCPSRARTRT